MEITVICLLDINNAGGGYLTIHHDGYFCIEINISTEGCAQLPALITYKYDTFWSLHLYEVLIMSSSTDSDIRKTRIQLLQVMSGTFHGCSACVKIQIDNV